MKPVILWRFILVSEKPFPRQLVLQATSSGPLVALELLLAGRTVKNRDKGADALRESDAGLPPTSSAQPGLQGSRFSTTALGTIETAAEAASPPGSDSFYFLIACHLVF